MKNIPSDNSHIILEQILNIAGRSYSQNETVKGLLAFVYAKTILNLAGKLPRDEQEKIIYKLVFPRKGKQKPWETVFAPYYTASEIGKNVKKTMKSEFRHYVIYDLDLPPKQRDRCLSLVKTLQVEGFGIP
jgi:hypothetical protein